jgi:hypothetical protein
MKGWNVALASAVIGIAASKDSHPSIAVLAVVPSCAFWALDAYYLALERVSGELIRWEEKRSDPRSAQRLRKQTPNGSVGSFPKVDRIRSERESLEVTQPLVSDIGYDSEVAIETSGDLRLVVTPAYPAFALPVSYACDGC